MATKQALEARRIKIRALIAKGLKPSEVQQELKIPPRTYYNDMKIIQAEGVSEAQKNYSMTKMLEMRDDLLRFFTMKRTTARSDEIALKAGMAADQCLSNLVKDFARIGLVPQEKQTLEMQGNMGMSLTELRSQALEALAKKEKQDAKEANQS